METMETTPRAEPPQETVEAPESGLENREGQTEEAAEPQETPAEKVIRLERITGEARTAVRSAESGLVEVRQGLELPPSTDDPPGIAADKSALAKLEAGLAEAEAERREQERATRVAELRQYLGRYLELRPDQNADSLRFERAADLAGDYAAQFGFLADKRLSDMEIAVVPDAMWAKGNQPSESHADKGLILVREGYFRDPKKEHQDESAWMTHELAHLQQSLDRGQDNYDKAQAQPAFGDLGPETYPNNQVEAYTFARQFEYLKTTGVDRAAAAELLRQDYGPEEFKFLDRILDKVYGK